MTSDQGQPNPYPPQPGVPPTPPPYPPPGIAPTPPYAAPVQGYAPMPPGYPPPGYVPPGYAPPGYAPPGYPGGPYGQPGYYNPYTMQPVDDAETVAKKAKAKKLVRISTWLGWGGVAMLFLGPVFAGVLMGTKVLTERSGGPLAVALAAIGILSAVAGAIIGQIGRAMQGRVV